MNSSKKNIASNLRFLRNRNRLTQEEVAERIGVTRQAVAKWESGVTLPDILNCESLADLYGVSLNDLVRYDPEERGMPIPPKDKHLFGIVTLGERGQVVLPKKKGPEIPSNWNQVIHWSYWGIPTLHRQEWLWWIVSLFCA